MAIQKKKSKVAGTTTPTAPTTGTGTGRTKGKPTRTVAAPKPKVIRPNKRDLLVEILMSLPKKGRTTDEIATMIATKTESKKDTYFVTYNAYFLVKAGLVTLSGKSYVPAS